MAPGMSPGICQIHGRLPVDTLVQAVKEEPGPRTDVCYGEEARELFAN